MVRENLYLENCECSRTTRLQFILMRYILQSGTPTTQTQLTSLEAILLRSRVTIRLSFWDDLLSPSAQDKIALARATQNRASSMYQEWKATASELWEFVIR